MGGPAEVNQIRELHDAEFRLLESKLMDLKDGVARLETTMARGVLLLVILRQQLLREVLHRVILYRITRSREI